MSRQQSVQRYPHALVDMHTDRQTQPKGQNKLGSVSASEYVSALQKTFLEGLCVFDCHIIYRSVDIKAVYFNLISEQYKDSSWTEW